MAHLAPGLRPPREADPALVAESPGERIAMVMTKAPTLARLIRASSAGLLTVATAWWVVEHVGDPHGTAIVHVRDPWVEVVVGDHEFRIEYPRSAPLVCELPAGRHVLRVSRGERVLYREVFTLDRGEHRVLVAWVLR